MHHESDSASETEVSPSWLPQRLKSTGKEVSLKHLDVARKARGIPVKHASKGTITKEKTSKLTTPHLPDVTTASPPKRSVQ
jgi:hypothetical protein